MWRVWSKFRTAFFLYLFIMLGSIWSWLLTKIKSNTKFYLKTLLYLFLYLLYEYSKRFVQPVVQPAIKCIRTLRRRAANTNSVYEPQANSSRRHRDALRRLRSPVARHQASQDLIDRVKVSGVDERIGADVQVADKHRDVEATLINHFT